MSVFHAKQYKAIAKVVNNSRGPTAITDPAIISPYWLVKMFVVMLRLDNPRFDEETFRIACGEKPEHSD